MVAEILAIIIFLGMFLLIILNKFERHMVTLVSGALVLAVVFGLCMHSGTAVVETLNLQCLATKGFWYGKSSGATSGINWSTIIFICGMMIMVEGLGKAGFFRWICLLVAKKVHYHTVPLLICFMVMSAVLSMFIDSITVVLFFATVTAEIAKVMEFNPVPMIISEIFCSNLGGAATMCGDPPNIIIGTSLGYTFSDFISNTGVIVGICFLLTLLYFWLCFRKELKQSENNRTQTTAYPQPAGAITNKAAFSCATLIFITAVVLLITHAQTTLSVAFIGVIVAALTVLCTFLTSGKENTKYIFTHLDYKTLLFFIGLFVAVSGLEKTGVLASIASFISSASHGNMMIMLAIILWISASASAFIDNIPFAATMVPVIRSIAATQNVPLAILAWTLSLGTDLGGNATPIGASANVVGTSVAAKEGHLISWGQYCKYCVPATLLVVGASMLCLFKIYL
ncbi:MAG: citrate transporter [Oscillospiraceae bacterium]|jgi:Na+/H+ antiporter NhaD/arsenite permease-like protein|nr:citrate transporter [Oscillospiraceae bacterium]